ncbi:alternate-type signal peptide domain-containing protein [Microbacterium testaceum]|uniref:alternate-type signal peptide domain-containing protein n=1 Tax=Microbacterium testaceum TaxID=2033 RepID=UPI001247BF12|nr:alternate-type signal peptide domain-containing protein [Microbacterium testaceum]
MSITDPAAPSTRRRTTRRHRRGKAIVAVAAGTALMLGGAGTYAFWSTSEALQATAVSSGNLDLALQPGSWELEGVLGGVTNVANVADVRIVPGDVLTLTQPIDVTLVGDTIVADLSAELGGSFSGGLGAYLDVALDLDGVGTANDATSYRLTAADIADEDGTQTVEATLTITFRGTTGGQLGAASSVNLDDVEFMLSQVGDN